MDHSKPYVSNNTKFNSAMWNVIKLKTQDLRRQLRYYDIKINQWNIE